MRTKINSTHINGNYLLQQRLNDDFEKTIEFCETMTKFTNTNQDILHNLCFTVKCTFFNERKTNKIVDTGANLENQIQVI